MARETKIEAKKFVQELQAERSRKRSLNRCLWRGDCWVAWA